MSISIDINRLQVSLHGVSASVAEAVVQGLEAELRRRVGVASLGRGASSGPISLDVAELGLRTIETTGTLNAAGLRGAIADRLVDAIQAQLPRPADGGS